MVDKNEPLLLRAYIEKTEGWWQAICVDLDIAAQGKTVAEAKHLLEDMIETYLESLNDCTPQERERFLDRKAPFSLRVQFAFRFAMATMFATRRRKDNVGFFHLSCPA